MEEESRLVSECPPPPAYFKRFKSASDVEQVVPPSVPSANATLNATQQYGSIISKNLPPTAAYDPTKDYKVELLRSLDEIMEKSMDMFKSTSQNISYELKFVELNASISRFNQLLNEFREHEAHYKLCTLAETKLRKIIELRNTMKSLLPT